jgi:PAS domain S-box-containing protein/TyrR family helix-turn-helix protein
MNPKLRLCFEDRVGIVANISSRIARYGFNIVAMEVIRPGDQAHVYLELENVPPGTEQAALLEIFRDIEGVFESRVIDYLPQQERENRFRVVLDNISDGVISIDRNGAITTINRVAQKALGFEGRQVVGRNIANLELPQNPILDCLNEARSKTIKQDWITPKGRLQYISTCRLIRDKARQIIGAVEIAKDVREIKKLANCLSEPGDISFTDIIGEHQTIREAVTYAKRIAETDAVVSIIGASGTGKELFARAIHTHSRRQGPFVPINCAALPDQLLESELFGYVPGSFTGGKREGAAGLFEIANNGTVFLDEVAEMPLSAQAKLLRLIQEQAVRRIGSSREKPINTRLITATNRNLENMVAEKRFRQDLYYRINVLPIHIPPLKARIEDIPLLVEHFLFQIANKLDRNVGSLTSSALHKLQNHIWPGNVRELKNVVERAAILCEGDTIHVDCILLGHELNQASQGLHHALPGSNGTSLKQHVSEVEIDLIRKALESAPSLRQAAKKLKISHPGLIKKMRKYNLHAM